MYPVRRIAAALILASALLSPARAADEPSAGLFDPLPSTAVESPAAADPAVLRSRGVALNPSRLQALLGARGSDRAGTLNLFDDLKLDITKLETIRSPLGPQVVRAAIAGGGTATLVINDGGLTAQIATGGRRITVQPLPDGAHRIIEFKKSTTPRPDDTFRPPRRDDAPQSQSPIEKPSAASTQIRILVVYTPKALSLLPSLAVLRSYVALMMADLNTTLANSQIPVEAVLAGIDQVNYTESATVTSQQMLDAARANTGDFARIQNVRYAASADIVSILSGYSDTSSCGRGALNDDLDTVPSSALRLYTEDGINVVSVNGGCLGIVEDTFTHETGHNLGGSHDRYVLTNPLPGPTFYAAGYVDLTGKFRDTMAYDDKCEANNVDCLRLQYFSNPSLTYNGRPIGITASQPDAADVSRRVREIAPYVAQFHGLLSAPTTPVLSVLVSGTGTVTSSTGGIDCGVTCAASISGAQQVTLTASAPAGWSFSAWSGACTGSTTCSVAMSTSRAVTATFIPTLRFGPVFSSAQASSQSFIRLANTGDSAGTATVTLWDYTTGTQVGQWTSPSVPAGTASQFGISTIESALTNPAAKPQYYAVSVRTTMNSTTQHVLWKPSDGTLTNLSTCDTGITANTSQVASVHSSVLDYGYPSSVAINNTGASAATGLALGIYDARNGAKLGTYTVASIPANSKLILTVAAIEASARITPTSGMFHYVIKVEGTLTGFLQHLVNNLQAAVTTDMTTVCGFGVMPTLPLTIAMRQPGQLYSTAQSASQSFLRFTNTGTSAGTVAVTLRNFTTGTKIGQWTSPSIAAGAAPQYAISEIESGMAIASKPQYYTAQIETQITGSVAHVLWKPIDGTLTNLSTCDAGVSANTDQVSNVHSTQVSSNYPSTVAVSNTGSSGRTFTLGVFDARTGVRLGGYTTTVIPANGQALVSVAQIESGAGVIPTSTQLHYVIKLEAGTGFLQHLVNNQIVGVITDMTTVCQLPTKVVSYVDCSPSATPRCTTAVGAATAGQLKQASSWANYSIALTAGTAYTINAKGASTNNGTLAQPYIFVYGPSGGSSLAGGGGGGTGNDARLTFTPTSSGTYTIQVTTYIFADNAGTFTLTVQ